MALRHLHPVDGPVGQPLLMAAQGRKVHVHLGLDLGTPAYKRLILTHHKNLNKGDFLVGDRPAHNGANLFEGELIPFSSSEFPTWPTVVEFLRTRA